ncbi:serine/threonine-protein kinase mos-like [Rhopilema esculentum]|uniref:serine/threonine-protein kinase mos-like n=1 Tax=Rhopilema esculentum TaxID=499914 RepID=UPI0031D2C48B|eukprot:gene7747-13580_t
MLCSVLRTITYQDILGFLKLVFLKDFDFYEKCYGNGNCNIRANKKSHCKNSESCENEQQAPVRRDKSLFEGINVSELEIGEKLGAGGFGAVYAVKYGSRNFALKKLHRINTKAARESFEAEASTLHLRHPNIVRTLSVFTMDESACILMEFISKRTLQTVISDVEKEDLPEKRRLRFALDISRGLSYAHSKGIAHLDIKPTNILITNNDVCKIGDFGCCQSMETSGNEIPMSPTKSNLTGTYAYRAPELFRGEFSTPQCDIYSTGICLWQMLVREKPYGSKNHHVVIFGVVAYNLRPSIPEDVQCGARYKQIMELCWHQNPLKRPLAKDLAKALEMTIAINK